MLFNFGLECAIRKVQANQKVLKLTGTHQLLVRADDINILGGGVHTVKRKAEEFVAVWKATDEKSKHVIMSGA